MWTPLLLGLLHLGLSHSWPMMGLDAFRNYDVFSLRPGETTTEFSSYDRLNQNNDGGPFTCLFNSTDGRCILAGDQGPGEIASIWFTYENDSVVGVGDITIELDGQTVLNAPLQDVVDGELGAPFVWPFVGNTNDTNGGNVIKIPMPYARTMQVTVDHNPHYYHVVYRRFPPDLNVTTFDLKEDISDVIETVQKFGVQDPKCPASASACPFSNTSRSIGDHYTLAAGKSLDIANVTGCGIITMLQLRIEEILGAPHVEDDGRAFGSKGGSSFTLQLDPENSQCQLTRRLDRSIGNQRASVSVDGQAAGEWNSNASMASTWYDEVLPIPPSLTAGKASIKVSNQFVSSDVDFNEFHYALHCLPEGSWSNHRYGSSKNWTLMDVLNVGANNPNDEKVHNYTISSQTWNGVRYYRYNDIRGAQAAQSLDLISNLYLTLSFDGKETVNAPVGSFFGSGLGKFDVRALMLSIDALIDNGAFTSWWPMPFTQSMTVGLLNKGNKTVHGSIDLIWAAWKDSSTCSAHGGSGLDTNWGYFSTQYNRSETVTGQYWNFLSTQGRGIACGVTQSMRGAILPPANTLEYLEGNEEVWVNQGGTQGPFTESAMHGTGTEDFYESGWYFTDAQDGPYGSDAVPFAMPFTGMTGHEIQELDCPGECVAAYRQMLPDSMAFENGISFNIQHGPVNNNINANYESTAYYYEAR